MSNKKIKPNDKSSKFAASKNNDTAKILISLSKMTSEEDYNLQSLINDNKKFALKLLQKLEQMTKTDMVNLMQRDKKHGGMEQIPIEQFDQRFVNDLIKHNFIGSDRQKLSVLRFGQDGRIMFVNDNNIIHILGIDIGFRIYPH